MRSLLRWIDKNILRGALDRWRTAHQERAALTQVDRFLGYSVISHYGWNKANYFASLCDTYGSDKGSNKNSGHVYSWQPHTYADYYSLLFDHCRDSVRSVFECGLGTDNPGFVSNMGPEGKPGASLRVWREYFPDASIYGADIDKGILFEEERIKTYYVDQTEPSAIVQMWREVGRSDFDLIIDDGLHTFDAAICFFENSISQLAVNGNYIVEDVNVLDFPRYREYFDDKPFVVDLVALSRPGLPLNSNSIVRVRKTQY